MAARQLGPVAGVRHAAAAVGQDETGVPLQGGQPLGPALAPGHDGQHLEHPDQHRRRAGRVLPEVWNMASVRPP